jgi:hypothetical protein
MNATYACTNVSEEHAAYIIMVEVRGKWYESEPHLIHVSSSTHVAKYKGLRLSQRWL